MSERLEIRSEPIVPRGAHELLKNLWAAVDRGEYPETCRCWKCQGLLELKDNPMSYPIGPYDLYFGRVPSYKCNPCDQQYFPEGVLNKVQELAESEVRRLDPRPPFINPAVLRYKQARLASDPNEST